MDVEHWKMILTTMECGSFTAAAEKSGYTVSALSRGVSSLEKELGFLLFYRKKNGVEPTADCLQLVPSIRELLFAADRLNQTAASIQGIELGTISIGTAYRHYYRWITDVTSRFHALHPGIQFRISNGTSTDFAEQLEQHQLDFCLISKRDGSHTWYPLLQDPLMALVPSTHPLAKKKSVSLKSFLSEPYIETCPGLDIDNSRFFHQCGIRPNTQFTSMDIQGTYAMVESGLGISMNNRINSMSSYPGVVHLPLRPAQMVEIGLACAKELSPSAKSFLQFILPNLPDDSQTVFF